MRTMMTLRTRDQKKSRRKLLQEHNTLTSKAAGKNDEHSSRGNGSTQLARVDLSGSSSFDGEELRNSLRHYIPLQGIRHNAPLFCSIGSRGAPERFYRQMKHIPTSVEIIQ